MIVRTKNFNKKYLNIKEIIFLKPKDKKSTWGVQKNAQKSTNTKQSMHKNGVYSFFQYVRERTTAV